MADDIAKNNFNDILSNLKRKFEITESKWTGDKLYEIKFRTQIGIDDEDYNKYCDHWVNEFSYVTDTTWVHKISNTGPKVKFRKQYQCWTYQEKKINKDILFDPRKCRATLDIKVLGDTRGDNSGLGPKKSNRYLRIGLNVLVKINFQHLHPVDPCQDYSFFVHWCKPLPEAPKPAASSNERVSELVAKVVENAPMTSQRAAERAKESVKKQCTGPPSFLQNQDASEPALDNQDQEETNYTELNTTENQSGTVTDQPSMTQVIVNSADGQSSDNVFYVHQVLFDSATQTLTEVIPIVENAAVHNIPENRLVGIRMTAESSRESPVLNNQPSENPVTEHF